MEETSSGTPVGVDDPYEHAGRCDYLTDDGRCRLALDAARGRRDAPRAFVDARRRDEFACVAADGETSFRDCEHYRATTDGRECVRCGLDALPLADRETDRRPLVEEHHLSYPDGATGHEITVGLCRWCHAKVHDSWARVDDDAAPDPEAVAAREERRSRVLTEGFEPASERRTGESEEP
ncbi:MAG: hypothetical protein ABEJ43_01700 [Haloferacaceae archaeon]